MRSAVKSNKRLALVIAIFLAVFSTGLVIAHQCNLMSSNQVSMQHNHSDHGPASATVTKTVNASSTTDRLIDSGCVALFVVVLLLGRKLLKLKLPSPSFNTFVQLSRDLVAVHRPQVFQLSLSLPQLGVIRI
jgi:hypothetical protein